MDFLRRRLGRLAGNLSRDQRGNASIEYAIIGAVVGLGLISALNSLKRAQNVNFDKISYAISEATLKNQAPKDIVREVPDAPYMDGGRAVTQKWVYYADGSRDLVRAGDWFTTSITNYNAQGVEVGATWIDINGYVTQVETTVLGPTTSIYKQSGNGSCNCTYRSSWSFDAQPNGSTNVIYKNDLIDGKNAAGWMYQQQTVVYNSSPGNWNYVGDVQTSRTGTISRYGSDISRYQ